VKKAVVLLNSAPAILLAAKVEGREKATAHGRDARATSGSVNAVQ
jgi:hypothetical protein